MPAPPQYEPVQPPTASRGSHMSYIENHVPVDLPATVRPAVSSSAASSALLATQASIIIKILVTTLAVFISNPDYLDSAC